ncbi:hypothetical protein R1flu_006796 [Riccia fluitans]|uniref:Protein BCCIP homolog n=1 Tax=Riccia fluitans TaxID=41844 RepID=A0ABD1Z149_9MARC
MGKRRARRPPAEAVPSSPSEASEPSSRPNESSSGSELNDSGDDSSSPSGSSDEGGIVNVDFEFFDPKPTDFHGVKALLKSYLDDAAWDISEFVDIFLAQTTVGTVIKTSDDDNPIGILTALNLARYKDRRCMKEICQYLLKNCTSSSEKEKLEAMWNQQAKRVGLIVSERLVNIPVDLVPHLYTSLLDEVTWATEDEPTKELQDYFKFKEYLVVTRVFIELPNKDSLKRKKKMKKNEGSLVEDGELIFIKPEDEVFYQLCSWSFSFHVKAEALAAHETKTMKQLRLVMGVQAKAMDRFKAAVVKLVDDGDG